MTMNSPGREGLLHDVTDQEWTARCDLAAAFRLGYHFGWNRSLSNHISLRLPDQPDRMLMNPYGIGWDEMSASALITVELGGTVLSHRDVELAPAGFNFHRGLLRARDDLACIFHCHPPAGVVLACTQDGLVIRDQTGCHLLGEVAYHDFEGFADAEEETGRILSDLGEKHLLIMWNHGLLTVGASLPEAFSWMRRLIAACELQERMLATGAPLRDIPSDILARTEAQLVERRKKRAYSRIEWAYNRRVADRVLPGYAV